MCTLGAAMILPEVPLVMLISRCQQSRSQRFVNLCASVVIHSS